MGSTVVCPTKPRPAECKPFFRHQRSKNRRTMVEYGRLWSTAVEISTWSLQILEEAAETSDTASRTNGILINEFAIAYQRNILSKPVVIRITRSVVD